ncbi:hypothetical protein [Priestia megaterium]|uniref:hypothetical protein n=1 Tax=Priestia megaterium TaxID=1404 RepID=UPI0015D4809F|nr:hypothetical protein [Priestia megaterium]
MQITLNQSEVKQAVIDYVNKKGVSTDGKSVDVFIDKDFANAYTIVKIREEDGK